MSIIHMTNIHKSFPVGDDFVEIIKGIDIQIKEGEFVAIMGPSGSGKSTLLYLMGFLDRFTEGEYIFQGENVTGYSDTERAHIRRDQLGFVFQSFNLLPQMTLGENVALPLIYAGIGLEERRSRAEKVLKEVGLDHRIDYKANRVSGGERQRTAIARALINNPTVIFADEPTGNLDTKSGQEVLEIFAELHAKEKRTIVMVTHEIEAAQYAQRIVNLRDGAIESDKKIKSRKRYQK